MNSIPQQPNESIPDGYEEWLDEIAEVLPPALPPRESLLKRLADAVTLSFLNLVQSTEEGTWLVPSRKEKGKEYQVTPGGCECGDFQNRKICAHWLATGDRSNVGFLVARIHRARDLQELERIMWHINDPSFVSVPDDLFLFVRNEWKIRRAEMMGHILKPAPVEKPDPFANFEALAAPPVTVPQVPRKPITAELWKRGTGQKAAPATPRRRAARAAAAARTSYTTASKSEIRAAMDFWKPLVSELDEFDRIGGEL
jgi:hypothetical protein